MLQAVQHYCVALWPNVERALGERDHTLVAAMVIGVPVWWSSILVSALDRDSLGFLAQGFRATSV